MKPPRRRSRISRLAAVLAALGLVVAGLVGTATEASAANDVSRPTIFVHGYNVYPWGVDCASQYNTISSELRRVGMRNNTQSVGFYSGDTNCNANLHGSGYLHGVDYADSASWKAVARAMSWYVWDNWTSRGIKIDLIGYSMGGLIVRGALYGAQIGEPGFAPPIDVGNAIALGAPFGGADGAWLCGPVAATQCLSMAAGSPDLIWLNRSCDAQGRYSTLWTVFGSTADTVARVPSATKMCTWPDRTYVLDNVVHNGSGSYIDLPWVTHHVIETIGGQTSRIYGGLPNKCLDVKNMSTAYGTPVQSFDCNNTYAQFWTRDRSGWPTHIMALGKCLDRANNGTAPGTKVWLWSCNGSPAQEWIQNTYDGTIRANGLCLDAPGGNLSNFTQLIIWTCNGGYGQRWA